MKKNIFIPALVLVLFGFTGCTPATNDPQASGKSVLNVQPRVVQNYKPEEKAKILADLTDAAKKEKYDAFADIISQIYQRGLQGDEDFVKLERDLYAKGGQYFDEGLTDQAYKMSSAIYPKVFESWRFKYLTILCLERYGTQALDKKDYAKAKDYAQKILHIEYRPEGANLMAKIAIQEAQNAIKKKDSVAAKAALKEVDDMEVSPDLRKQIDEMKKTLGN